LQKNIGHISRQVIKKSGKQTKEGKEGKKGG